MCVEWKYNKEIPMRSVKVDFFPLSLFSFKRGFFSLEKYRAVQRSTGSSIAMCVRWLSIQRSI